MLLTVFYFFRTAKLNSNHDNFKNSFMQIFSFIQKISALSQHFLTSKVTPKQKHNPKRPGPPHSLLKSCQNNFPIKNHFLNFI